MYQTAPADPLPVELLSTDRTSLMYRSDAPHTLRVPQPGTPAWRRTPPVATTATGRHARTLSRQAGATAHTHRPARADASRRGLGRKIVSILFADLKGSTSLCGSIGLDEWWWLIGLLFEDMSEGVQRFGGWVEGFTGDGIMGVFETQRTTEEHARRACEAALWIRDMMGSREREISREKGIAVSVRIGVNSGEVLIGTIGGHHGRHYTAGGYAVGLAKRIEELATPGSVLLGEDTATLVARTHALRDRGEFDVKGGTAPVRAFELIGPR